MPSGGYTTNECCPAGYETITTETECRTAYDSLGITTHWGGYAARNNRPPGCFRHQPNMETHFNPLSNVAIGASMVGNDEVMCKQV
jgi:hypothetical protein